jgi:hypothetical protein
MQKRRAFLHSIGRMAAGTLALPALEPVRAARAAGEPGEASGDTRSDRGGRVLMRKTAQGITEFGHSATSILS